MSICKELEDNHNILAVHRPIYGIFGYFVVYYAQFMTTNAQQALRDAVDTLIDLAGGDALAAHLGAGKADLVTALEERVRAEVDAYSASANPDILPQLRQHLSALVEVIGELLTSGQDQGLSGLAFVAAYARLLSQQRFPLEATLHTYRCSHRVVAGWVRDAALAAADSDAQVRRVVAAAADFALEFTDAISTVATAEYVAETRRLAEAESDRRTVLLNALLQGHDEADARTAQYLRRAGYLEQRQSFCVVVARSVDPREMDNPARAQRMVDAVADVLRDTPVRKLIGVREGIVTAVLSGTRRLSGWTAPQTLLAERVLPRLQQIGPAAVIGLSDDAPSTSHVRRAHKEALIALDFADVAHRVVPYSRIPFRQMLVRHARENVQSSLPGWLGAFQRADDRARQSLSNTLLAYADANMNAQQTAKALSIHANTVYSRMQRIDDTTGKNPLHYHDLTELLLAIESAATNH